jgi:steroid delta-isomerase-like uncharacterized protein
MHSAEQLARASLEHFNQGEWEAMRAELAPDFVYEETGTGRRVTDADEMIAGLRRWKVALPDVTGTIDRMVVDGDTVVMEIIWRGTQSGALSTPAGDIPPSGRPVQVWASFWQVWKDDRIVEERHHLDMLAMLAQIGAIPVPA